MSEATHVHAGRLLGVGVGPGDPELMTLKAMRALGRADVVVHFAKAGNASHSRAIASRYLRTGVTELALLYPLTTELPKCSKAYRDAIRDFYDQAAEAIAAQLATGRVVAVICEGDPLFYGSYMHLHARLAPRFPTEIVAGVTGMSGCWSAAGIRSRRATTCSPCFRRRYPKPSWRAASQTRTPSW
jgi:precorrin-2/cobalt-factor-2 C20-methyltransferase